MNEFGNYIDKGGLIFIILLIMSADWVNNYNI